VAFDEVVPQLVADAESWKPRLGMLVAYMMPKSSPDLMSIPDTPSAVIGFACTAMPLLDAIASGSAHSPVDLHFAQHGVCRRFG